MIHRLVAETFIKNPENYFYINHKDGDKTNNNINNLEWCDNSHNVREAYRLGLNNPILGEKHHLSVSVNQYDLKGNLIKTWNCMRDIQRELGFEHTNISRCCRNKQKTAYGFIWRYTDGDSKNKTFENNFISKDGIREKIEELETNLSSVKQMNESMARFTTIQKLDYQIQILKELLGEEK